MKTCTVPDVVFDPKLSNAINYVKARYAIDESGMARKDRRESRMLVVKHFNGRIDHIKKGNRTDTVVIFPDNTKAHF